MKFASSAIVQYSGADVPENMPSSSAFTCLWEMVESELCQFSISVCLCHQESKL